MTQRKKPYQYGNHEKLIAWQMADQLDKIVQEILKFIPKNEYKLRSQVDNASDSVGSNIVEGHYSGLLGELIRFLRYSRRSVGELQERVRRVLRKGYINEELFKKFNEVAIKTGYIIDRLIQSKEKEIAEEDK
ncbi:MAG: four helix bundle protein [Candidatus Parcubacteria bacterium]|nr:four helix bundle protein [Candidatus Parcubacteria bacterium]